MLSEISQREKDKYCMISLTCSFSKTKQKNQVHRNREQTDDCHRGGCFGDVGEMGEEGQNLQTFSYKISRS